MAFGDDYILAHCAGAEAVHPIRLFTLDLRRDHIKSGFDFQRRMLEQPISYAEFCGLLANYGRRIIRL